MSDDSGGLWRILRHHHRLSGMTVLRAYVHADTSCCLRDEETTSWLCQSHVAPLFSANLAPPSWVCGPGVHLDPGRPAKPGHRLP